MLRPSKRPIRVSCSSLPEKKIEPLRLTNYNACHRQVRKNGSSIYQKTEPSRGVSPSGASVGIAPAVHRPKTSPCRPNRPPGKNRGEVEGVDAGGPRTGRAGCIGCGGLRAMHACARSSPSATPSRTSASALSSSIPCSRSPPNAVAEPRTSVRRVAHPAGPRLRCRERERERYR
jgi:hypothetical protein